jgi:hypothetical protein
MILQIVGIVLQIAEMIFSIGGIILQIAEIISAILAGIICKISPAKTGSFRRFWSIMQEAA